MNVDAATVGKVTISSISGGNQSITVKYSKVSNIKGYHVIYKKTNASKWSSKWVVGSSNTSCTITGLSNNTSYYVKVRAYKMVSGKANYGAYSAQKTVTTKKASTSTTTTKTTSSSSRTQIEQKIVALAKSKLGCKYKYGASGPNTFDCSGFTSYVMKNAANITIPRTSSAQHTGGTIVSISNLKVGDIVWRSGHVGIYVGNGKVIHSPRTGDVVKYTTASSFKCGVRYF